MKYSVMLSCVAFAVVASAQQTPTFVQLGEELKATITPQSIALVQEIVPFASQMNIAKFLNGSSTVDISVKDVIEILAVATNGLSGFHAAVDAAGGLAAYQSATNEVMAAYTYGLIGHLNANNQVSPEMANVTSLLASINNLTAQLLYQDLYQLVEYDIENLLFNEIGAIVPPAVSIFDDVIDIIQAARNIFSRRRLRSSTGMERRLSVISSLDSIEGFFCKDVEPLLTRSVTVMQAIVAPSTVSDLDSLEEILSKIGRFVHSVEDMANAVAAVNAEFKEYAPMIQNDVIPMAQLADSQLQQICASQTDSNRMLTNVEFKPFDWLMKLFDAIEGGVEKFIAFLEKLSFTVAKDIIHAVEDVVKWLFPKVANDIKEIVQDITDITENVPELVAALKKLPSVLDVTKDELMVTIGDVKSLMIQFIALVKTIA